MGGIAGFIDTRQQTTTDRLRQTAYSMGASLHHRGPDSYGVWTDAATGIAFAHRRRIMMNNTLRKESAARHQPMRSTSGRFTIVLDGQIDNFRQLQRPLIDQGASFPFGNDLELLLNLFERYDIANAISLCTGSFAIAVWDNQEQRLSLIRDRMGEKPLFFGQFGRSFLFASEVQAFRAHEDFATSINGQSLNQLIQIGLLSGSRSILNNVQKLAPGCLLTFEPNRSLPPQVQPYWSLKCVAERGQKRPITDAPEKVVDQLAIQLSQIVRDQLVPHARVGVFLTGSIESTIVAAVTQSMSPTPLKTFSVTTPNTPTQNNDGVHSIAKHLRTDHTELCITPRDILAALPGISQNCHQPIVNVSWLPIVVGYERAREHADLLFTDTGANAVFARHRRYLRGERLWNIWRKLPAWIRPLVGHSLPMLASVGRLLGSRVEPIVVQKLTQMLSTQTTSEFFQQLFSDVPLRQSPVLQSDESRRVDADQWSNHDVDLADFISQIQFYDSISRLPNDDLAHADFASIHANLHVRHPFLDHRCVEFAWQLPMSMKVHENDGMRIFDQLARRYVPAHFLQTAQRRFRIPLSDWLRNELRDWGELQLDESRLRREGLFIPENAREMWHAHQNGAGHRPHVLWRILMFQCWHQEFSTTTRWTPIPIRQVA